VLSAVGCGDYLLAGFHQAVETADPCEALAIALKVAAARLGWTETRTWAQASAVIALAIQQV
jgi:fructose-1-phosphate kinase PfkB-like protein